MVPIDWTLDIIMIKGGRASMPRNRSSMTWNKKMVENPLDSTVPWLRVIGFERPLLVRLLDMESNRTKSPTTWFQGRIYNVLSSALVLLLLWRASLGKVVLEYRPSLWQYLRVLDRVPVTMIYLYLRSWYANVCGSDREWYAYAYGRDMPCLRSCLQSCLRSSYTCACGRDMPMSAGVVESDMPMPTVVIYLCLL